MTFVLLGRDIAAPVAIRAWIEARIRCGKNQIGDAQMRAAELAARRMEVDFLTIKECRHERLDEDGICRGCGTDRRGA